MSSTSVSDAGQVLGHYRLERKVAKGGMGEIWRATDLRTEQVVAIKRMLISKVGELSQRHRVRMMREASALQQLRHEHIVRYLETGFDDEGQPYLVLEWLDGDDLEHRHRRAPLSLSGVLELAGQALSGLAVCHEQGIIHRDVKPGNLFLVEGEQLTVKLVDFGLALLGNEISRLTRAGQIIGTLYYLSPEQARGERNVDHRSDLYAMGVVLYELVTGKLPFWSDRPAAVLLKIVSETPPRPRQLRPDTPTWLEQVIQRAMQRDPAARFDSAAEMLGALRPTTHRLADSLSPVSIPAEHAELETLPPTVSTVTREYRLVTLLCVLPTAAEEGLAPVVTEAVGAVRGVVYSLLGGQTVGIFGLDRTVGDEGLRAVQAGLAVREAAGERARLLAATVHLAVGNGLQLDGKELDQATELLGTLPPGELVLDRPTLELLGGKVETRVTEGHVAAQQLLAEVPVRRRVLGVETPTVGRELELASIRAARQRAEDDEEPEALLLLGQPGIGKSRLYDDVVPELVEASALCLEGRARSSQTKTPYGLLADALARGAGIHVGQPAEEQRAALEALVLRHAPDEAGREALLFIGEALGLAWAEETDALRAARAEPKLMRTRTARAFETFLRSAAARGLVCLCLEDLHWADDESLELCEQLVDRLDRTPLFLFCTARPELLERRAGFLELVDATRVELHPLKRRPLRKLLGALLGEGLGRELEQVIASWSDGNPYFAEELVSWMVTRSILVRREGGWRLTREPLAEELPAGIEGAIQGRLDGLAMDPKDLLKAASVFGEVFWQDGCVALGFADAALKLRELEAAQFVIRRPESRIPETSEWAFRHALLQQVAYGMLPEERRQPLHLQVARWLEQVGERDAALLAQHFELGGARARAAGYHAQAGDRALAEGHPERAEACYLAALEGAGDDRDEGPRRDEGPHLTWPLKLARAHFVAGHLERASAVLASLESKGFCDEPRRAAEATFLRGQILMWKGDYNQAAAVLRQAGAEACDDEELAFEIWRVLFWVFWGQGKYQEAGRVAEALYNEALDSGRPEHLSPAKLAFAYYNVVQGDLSASVRLSKEAVGHAREIGHPYGEIDSLTLLGSAQELVGQYDEAMLTLEEGHARTREMKLPIHQAIIEACMGRVCLIQNRIEQALAHYGRARSQAEPLGDYRTAADALAGEARALCRRSLAQDEPQGQDIPQATAAVHRAVDLVADRAPPVLAEARLAQAELALAAQRSGEAVKQILAAVELLDRLGGQEQCEIEILLTAHDVLRVAGRREEALAMLDRAWRTLQQRAERITDEAVRESFTRRVPHNLRVAELWQAAAADGEVEV
jgi:eukaryotic-like serine/threonine-protein kinase